MNLLNSKKWLRRWAAWMVCSVWAGTLLMVLIAWRTHPSTTANILLNTGKISFRTNANRILGPGDEEQVLEAMLGSDVNVDEIECENGTVTIFAPPSEFYKAKTALLQAFPDTELEVQEITFLPQSTVTLSDDDLAMFQKFMSMLNDCDDVQDVFHNVNLPA